MPEDFIPPSLDTLEPEGFTPPRPDQVEPMTERDVKLLRMRAKAQDVTGGDEAPTPFSEGIRGAADAIETAQNRFVRGAGTALGAAIRTAGRTYQAGERISPFLSEEERAGAFDRENVVTRFGEDFKGGIVEGTEVDPRFSDPKYDPSKLGAAARFTGDVVEGLGQFVPLGVVGGVAGALTTGAKAVKGAKTAMDAARAVAKAKGVAAAQGAAAFGFGQEFDDAWERSEARGDSPDERFAKSLGYGSVAALIENKLGAGRIVRKYFPDPATAVKKLTARGVSYEVLKDVLAGGVEEGAQRIAQNVIVGPRDPKQSRLTWDNITEGALDEALVGGVVQGVAGIHGTVGQAQMRDYNFRKQEFDREQAEAAKIKAAIDADVAAAAILGAQARGEVAPQISETSAERAARRSAEIAEDTARLRAQKSSTAEPLIEPPVVKPSAPIVEQAAPVAPATPVAPVPVEAAPPVAGNQVALDELRNNRGGFGSQGVSEDGIKQLFTFLKVPAATVEEGLAAIQSDPAVKQRVTEFLIATPVKATRLPDDSIHIDDGHHRLWLADKLGLKSAPVEWAGETPVHPTFFEPPKPGKKPKKEKAQKPPTQDVVEVDTDEVLPEPVAPVVAGALSPEESQQLADYKIAAKEGTLSTRGLEKMAALQARASGKAAPVVSEKVPIISDKKAPKAAAPVTAPVAAPAPAPAAPVTPAVPKPLTDAHAFAGLRGIQDRENLILAYEDFVKKMNGDEVKAAKLIYDLLKAFAANKDGLDRKLKRHFNFDFADYSGVSIRPPERRLTAGLAVQNGKLLLDLPGLVNTYEGLRQNANDAVTAAYFEEAAHVMITEATEKMAKDSGQTVDQINDILWEQIPDTSKAKLAEDFKGDPKGHLVGEWIRMVLQRAAPKVISGGKTTEELTRGDDAKTYVRDMLTVRGVQQMDISDDTGAIGKLQEFFRTLKAWFGPKPAPGAKLLIDIIDIVSKRNQVEQTAPVEWTNQYGEDLNNFFGGGISKIVKDAQVDADHQVGVENILRVKLQGMVGKLSKNDKKSLAEKVGPDEKAQARRNQIIGVLRSKLSRPQILSQAISSVGGKVEIVSGTRVVQRDTEAKRIRTLLKGAADLDVSAAGLDRTADLTTNVAQAAKKRVDAKAARDQATAKRDEAHAIELLLSESSPESVEEREAHGAEVSDVPVEKITKTGARRKSVASEGSASKEVTKTTLEDMDKVMADAIAFAAPRVYQSEQDRAAAIDISKLAGLVSDDPVAQFTSGLKYVVATRYFRGTGLPGRFGGAELSMQDLKSFGPAIKSFGPLANSFEAALGEQRLQDFKDHVTAIVDPGSQTSLPVVPQKAYGYWVAPDGTMHPTDDHFKEALEILGTLEQQGKLSKEILDVADQIQNNYVMAAQAMFSLGYLRMVRNVPNHYMVEGRAGQQPQSAQRKMLKDFGIVHESAVQYFSGEQDKRGVSIYEPDAAQTSLPAKKNQSIAPLAYGYWVTPSGEMLPTEDHPALAGAILKRKIQLGELDRKALDEVDGETPNIYHLMGSLGYLRVARSRPDEYLVDLVGDQRVNSAQRASLESFGIHHEKSLRTSFRGPERMKFLYQPPSQTSLPATRPTEVDADKALKNLTSALESATAPIASLLSEKDSNDYQSGLAQVQIDKLRALVVRVNERNRGTDFPPVSGGDEDLASHVVRLGIDNLTEQQVEEIQAAAAFETGAGSLSQALHKRDTLMADEYLWQQEVARNAGKPLVKKFQTYLNQTTKALGKVEAELQDAETNRAEQFARATQLYDADNTKPGRAAARRVEQNALLRSLGTFGDLDDTTPLPASMPKVEVRDADWDDTLSPVQPSDMSAKSRTLGRLDLRDAFRRSNISNPEGVGTVLFARWFQKFDYVRSQIRKMTEKARPKLAALVDKLDGDYIQAQGEASTRELDLKAALSTLGGKTGLLGGDLVTVAERDALIAHEAAISLMARKLVEQLKAGDIGAQSLFEFLSAPTGVGSNYLGQPGQNNLGKTAAAKLGVSEEVFQLVLSAVDKSEPFRNSLVAVIEDRVNPGFFSERLQALEQALNDPALHVEDAKLRSDATARLRSAIKGSVGYAQTRKNNASREVREVARQILSVSTDLQEIDLLNQVIDSIEASPEFNAARTETESANHSFARLMIDFTATGARVFRAFSAPKVVDQKAYVRPPGTYDSQAAPKINEWYKNAETYLAAYNNALLEYTMDPKKPSPSQLGFDAVTANGLSYSILMDKDEFINAASLDPKNNRGLQALPSWMWAQDTYLGWKRLAIGQFFTSLQTAAGVVPGDFGRTLRRRVGALMRSTQDAQGALQSAVQLNLYKLRDEAIDSHGFHSWSMYREKVQNPAMARGRAAGMPLKAGMLLPETGVTLTAKDMEYFKVLSRTEGSLFEVAQKRADKATVESLYGQELSRFAAANWRYKVSRVGGDRLSQFAEEMAALTEPHIGAAGDPAYQFWNNNFSHVVAHVVDAGQKDYVSAISQDATIKELKRKLAVSWEAGDAVPTDLRELVLALKAQPGGDQVTEVRIQAALFQELNQIADNLSEKAASDGVSETGSDTGKHKDQAWWAKVASDSNEYRTPWAPARFPSSLYEYGALTDQEFRQSVRRASAHVLIELDQALGAAITDISTKLDAYGKATDKAEHKRIETELLGPTKEEAAAAKAAGITLPAGEFRSVFEAQSILTMLQSQRAVLPAHFGNLITAHSDEKQNLTLLRLGKKILWDIPIRAMLASPPVIATNVILATGPAMMRYHDYVPGSLGQTTWDAMRAGAAQGAEAFSLVTQAVANATTTPVSKWLTKQGFVSPKSKVGKWLLWLAQAPAREAVATLAMQRLGVNGRLPVSERHRSIRHGMDMFDTEAEYQQYLKDLNDPHASVGHWAKSRGFAKLDQLQAWLDKVGTAAGDPRVNASMVPLFVMAENRFEEVAFAWAAARSDELRGDFNAQDPRRQLKSSDWVLAGDLPGPVNKAVVSKLRETLEFSGVGSLEQQMWDFVQRAKADPNGAHFFVDDTARAFFQQFVADTNAPSIANTPGRLRADPGNNVLMTLLQYGFRWQDRVMEGPSRTRRLRGDEPDGLNLWAMSRAIFMLGSLMVTGLLAIASSEEFWVWFSRRGARKDTLFRNPQKMLESGQLPIHVAAGIAKAFATPGVAEMLTGMTSADGFFGKSIDPTARIVPLTMIRDYIQSANNVATLAGQPITEWPARLGPMLQDETERRGSGYARGLMNMLTELGFGNAGRLEANRTDDALTLALSRNPAERKAQSFSGGTIKPDPLKAPIRGMFEAKLAGDSEKYDRYFQMYQDTLARKNAERAERGQAPIPLQESLQSSATRYTPFYGRTQNRLTPTATATMLDGLNPEERARVENRLQAASEIAGRPLSISVEPRGSSPGGGGGSSSAAPKIYGSAAASFGGGGVRSVYGAPSSGRSSYATGVAPVSISSMVRGRKGRRRIPRIPKLGSRSKVRGRLRLRGMRPRIPRIA